MGLATARDSDMTNCAVLLFPLRSIGWRGEGKGEVRAAGNSLDIEITRLPGGRPQALGAEFADNFPKNAGIASSRSKMIYGTFLQLRC